jgi:hypothetical protein
MEFEHKGMSAAPKYGSLLKLHYRDILVRRICSLEDEAVAFREETSESTGKVLRGMGPDTITRTAEIMSGRANSQQGLMTTCKDSPHKEAKLVRGFWSDA